MERLVKNRIDKMKKEVKWDYDVWIKFLYACVNTVLDNEENYKRKERIKNLFFYFSEDYYKYDK